MRDITLSKVKVVTGENFNAIINDGPLTIIDCWAAWCGPCRMISPIIDELSEQYTQVTFGKLNVDENKALAAKFDIMAIPTLLFLKGGKLVDTLVGAVPKSVIEDKIHILS